MNFESMPNGEQEKPPAFEIGSIVYETATGHSFRVQGYSPEGKVVAIRERTEGEQGESDRNAKGDVFGEGPREFGPAELHVPAGVDLLNDAEVLSGLHEKDQEMIRQKKEKPEG